ncbi:hypothetical protein [Streptacidiphilus sp. EB129]|uniref:hypothetical protein n=1 Tax=Streptacidiphilus sp. EB129 TaxID=3156262 RepID=UPI00351998DF
MLAVTPELSLAWKVTRLVNDIWPRGRDMYDAALLAELHPLPYSLLGDAMRDADPRTAEDPFRLVHLLELDLGGDREHSANEYPGHVASTWQSCLHRLAVALEPELTRVGARERGPVTQAEMAAWLASPIARYRHHLDSSGDLDAVLVAMADDGVRLRSVVVITRELLDPTRCTPHAAWERIAHAPVFTQWLPWAARGSDNFQSFLNNL